MTLRWCSEETSLWAEYYLPKRWNESIQGHCFFKLFFILCLPDQNNHYVMHRSGIVEVSSVRIHYYVKESDLCQGDFNIIISTIIVVYIGHGLFIVRYLCRGQIKYDLYETIINDIRILCLSRRHQSITILYIIICSWLFV